MTWTARLVPSFALCVALGMSVASAEDKIQFEHVLNIGSAGKSLKNRLSTGLAIALRDNP